jgi:hypothetical protein
MLLVVSGATPDTDEITSGQEVLTQLKNLVGQGCPTYECSKNRRINATATRRRGSQPREVNYEKLIYGNEVKRLLRRPE